MDSKISNLDLISTVTPDDVLPIVNNGITKKVKISQLNIPSIAGLATTTYVDTQDALKVDKVIGKGLSTEDYTTTEKNKLAGIAVGAEVNVNADWNSVSGDSQILNKPTIPTTTDYVPYTGATANVNLGEFGLATGQITLDVTPTGTSTVATTRWNDTLGSSETTLKGGTVVLKNGVDLVARIVNKVTPNTTLTKANYQAVRISGATGQRLSVELAKGDADLNSADTIGLVTETIATNQEGFIITMGLIEDINTTGSLQSETWVDGDVLYLSPTVAGRLTNVKPNGLTGHIVVIGYVEYAHINQGKIYVKIMNGWELDELHNVYIDNALANEDFLQYESATELWKNKPLTATLIRSKLGITTLSGSNTGDNATNTQYSGLATSKQDKITLTTIGTSGASTLVGATLNIPQYISGGSSFQSAFTILANNTNVSALTTEQVYKDVEEQSYTGGTPTWSGTTAPSGTTNHSYQWSQIGKTVNLRVNLDYSIAGSGLTEVNFDLPSDCPLPKIPAGVNAVPNVINYGNGMIGTARNIAPSNVAFSALRIKSLGTPNIYEIAIIRTSGAYRFGCVTIQYFAQ